jgi:hypothetical protein
MWGNTVAKQNYMGNIVTIHNILKKKTMKQNSQPAQYEKNKTNKDHFRKKKFIKKRKKKPLLKKIHRKCLSCLIYL